MKKGPIVEGLHESCGLGKVRGGGTEQTGRETNQPWAEALPFNLKHIADHGMQPVTGGMNAAEDLFRSQSR
jgi:hypothetical protein